MARTILRGDLPEGELGDLALRLLVLGGLRRRKQVNKPESTASPADWLRLLAWLPWEQRAAVAMWAIHDATGERIADFLGIEVTTSRGRSVIFQRLQTAYKTLAPLIQQGAVFI